MVNFLKWWTIQKRNVSKTRSSAQSKQDKYVYKGMKANSRTNQNNKIFNIRKSD